MTAFRERDTIVVLVPQRMSKALERTFVDDLVKRVLAREARVRTPRSDAALTARATALAAPTFPGRRRDSNRPAFVGATPSGGDRVRRHAGDPLSLVQAMPDGVVTTCGALTVHPDERPLPALCVGRLLSGRTGQSIRGFLAGIVAPNSARPTQRDGESMPRVARRVSAGHAATAATPPVSIPWPSRRLPAALQVLAT